MLRLRHLGSARFAAVFILGACACAPIVGCGSSTDTGTGDEDTGGVDDSSVDSAVDDTTVKPDTAGKDTNVDDTTVPTDTNPPTDTTPPTDTSGTDTTGTDTATDSATDSGTDAATDSATDTATDSGPTCPSGTKCSTAGGASGICAADNATCAACVDTTDDAKCATAYGAGNICVGGACVGGNCHADTACSAPTPTCGFLSPNTCGGCTSDAQCTTAGQICNVTSGLCVSNACTGASASTCSANPGDICCAATAAGTPGICVGGTTKASGGCCWDGDCTGAFTVCKKPTGATGATAGVCTSCTVPTTGPFIVNPVNGSDASGTGNTGTCAFKTVTRALAFLGGKGSATTIQVVGGSTLCTVASTTCTTTETLPINIPANYTIQGGTGGATLVLRAGGGGFGSTGFVLSAANSSLQNFTIDGGAHVGSRGVIVNSGSSSTTTILANVIVKNTANEGITVGNFGGGGGAAGLLIEGGVSVTGAGTAGTPRSGLRIQGNSVVVINPAAGGTGGDSFSSNTQHGIEVDNNSSITITGTPGATADAGTVIANSNTVAGLFINQAAGGGTVPLCSVNGLVVFGTSAGNGIRIAGGSKVKLRNSSSLGNSGSGIHIATSGGGGGGGSADVTGIDLGKAGDFGGNTVQAPTTAGGPAPNGGAGICLELTGAASTVSAQGNKFGGTAGTTVNCATVTAGSAAAKLKTTATAAGFACTGKNDVGTNNSTSYKVDVTNCNYP